MKLRLARKLFKAVGTDRERAYTPRQMAKAIARVLRTRSSKDDTAWWNRTVEELPLRYRVEAAVSIGWLDVALDLLMEAPEQSW